MSEALAQIREGARIVWMPTVDSPAETAGRTEPKPGDKVPLTVLRGGKKVEMTVTLPE